MKRRNWRLDKLKLLCHHSGNLKTGRVQIVLLICIGLKLRPSNNRRVRNRKRMQLLVAVKPRYKIVHKSKKTTRKTASRAQHTGLRSFPTQVARTQAVFVLNTRGKPQANGKCFAPTKCQIRCSRQQVNNVINKKINTQYRGY